MRAQAPSGGNMRKNSRRVIVSVVSLVVVAAIAVVGLKVLAARKTAAALAAKRAGVASIYVVAPQDVATLTTVSGTVAPLRSATLTAQAQGAITAVYKKEGDSVKAGDVIVRIDSTSQDNQLAQAESRYRVAVTTFKTAQMTDLAQTKQQLESAVSQALAQQLSAEVNLRNFTDKDTSDQTIANLQQQVKQAEIGLINAQNSLKSLQEYDTSAQQQTLSDLSVTQAQQNLSNAEAKLVTLTTAVPATLQTAIDAQLASIDAARLSLQNAQVNAQMTAATIGRGKIQIDNATLAVEQAQDSVTAANNNLAMTQKTIGARANDLEVLQSNVEQAKSSVTLARSSLAAFADTQKKSDLQLQSAKEQENQALLTLQAQQLTSDNYVVKAPWDGVITSLNVQVGDQATSATSATSATTATVIADTSGWNVQAYVDELDVLHVKAGQDASVTMDAYPNQAFKAKVTYVGHALVTTSNSVSAYAIKIQFTNPPTTPVAGMTADASITTSSAKGVLAVPVESILSENGKNYVTVITTSADKKTTATRTEVKTGIEGDVYVQITSGLKAGDRILRTASTTSTSSSTSSSSTTTTNGGGGNFFRLAGGR
jgi:HlyD family secretion protein